MSQSLYNSLVVKQVRQETADACSFELELPPALAKGYQYQAGQFLTFKVPHQDGELLRCYSMSSSPATDSHLQVTVKRVVDGRASNWFCDNLHAGDTIDVMRPSGVFVVKDFSQDIICYAGGSGITPMFSIIKTMLKQGSGKVRLIYANRDIDSIIFKHELNRLRKTHPTRLEIIHLLEDITGIPSKEHLTALSYHQTQAPVYICGPGPFMDAVENGLLEAGFIQQQLRIERFISLDKPQTDSTDISTSTGEANVSVEIDMFGNHYVIDCAEDETILNAARRQNVELPFSCEAGMCASCMCEIKDGEVELLNNDVLTEQDIERGLTLTCQAVPSSKKISLKYT